MKMIILISNLYYKEEIIIIIILYIDNNNYNNNKLQFKKIEEQKKFILYNIKKCFYYCKHPLPIGQGYKKKYINDLAHEHFLRKSS